MKMEKTHLEYCIQCTDKRTGKVGSFIFKENEHLSSIGDAWFWPDCYEMFKFMGCNGFDIKGGADFHLYRSAERGA